jgi:hypothetical protein
MSAVLAFSGLRIIYTEYSVQTTKCGVIQLVGGTEYCSVLMLLRRSIYSRLDIEVANLGVGHLFLLLRSIYHRITGLGAILIGLLLSFIAVKVLSMISHTFF